MILTVVKITVNQTKLYLLYFMTKPLYQR